ncbi:unnamed protein product [Prunus armeniaca]
MRSSKSISPLLKKQKPRREQDVYICRAAGRLQHMGMNNFQAQTPEEPRDINVQAVRKRSTLRTSIHTPIPFLIRPGHGKRKERNEGDGWEWKSPTETAAGKGALSSQKSLLGRGNFTKIGKVK